MLLTISNFAQTGKIIWITNLNEYSDKSIPIEEVLDSVNTVVDLNLVIFSGDLTKSGEYEEIEAVNKLLDNLNAPCIVLPGKSEISRLGLISFRKFWFDLNYSFVIGDAQIIGLTGESFLNSGDLIITKETLQWLSDNVNPEKHIYIFTNSPDPNNYRNINEVMTSIPDSSFAGFLALADLKKKPLPLLSARLSEENNNKFNLIMMTLNEDTTSLSTYTKNNLFKETAAYKTKVKIDSSIYKSEPENLNDLEIVFRKEFNSTLIAKPVHYENVTYICERKGLITALDTTGATIWDYDAYGDIVSVPVIAKGKFVAATYQGDLIILDALTGESIETIGFEDYITSDLLAMEYQGNKELLIRGETDSKTAIVFGTSSGKIYCYDLDTVQEYWVNSEAADLINTQIEIAGNKIIATSQAGNIYCIDAKRGWLTWRWNERTSKDKDIYDYSLLIHEDKVFAASTSGKVFGIDLKLGKTLWQSDAFRSPCTAIALSPNQKNLLAKVYNNKLILLSQKTGTNLDVVQYSRGYDEIMGNVFIYESDMFATSGDGVLYKMKNFKNSEMVFELGNRIPLSVQNIKDNQFLVSTIDGLVLMVKF